MAKYKCVKCGSILEFPEGTIITFCSRCGTKHSLPEKSKVGINKKLLIAILSIVSVLLAIIISITVFVSVNVTKQELKIAKKYLEAGNIQHAISIIIGKENIKENSKKPNKNDDNYKTEIVTETNVLNEETATSSQNQDKNIIETTVAVTRELVTRISQSVTTKPRSTSKPSSGSIKISNVKTIAADNHTVYAMKNDGSVIIGESDGTSLHEWYNIASLDAGDEHIVGLKKDGTVVADGSNRHGRCDVSGWTDIVQVAAGYEHTVGLKKDGTVVSTTYTDRGVMDNYEGQDKVESWTDIVQIDAVSTSTLGLKKDGTVVVAGDLDDKEISKWTNIVRIWAGRSGVIGLKSDGTFVCTSSVHSDVLRWTDIADIFPSRWGFYGVKTDGTVVYAGLATYGLEKVDSWTNIIAVAGTSEFAVGLKKDGTVVVTNHTDSEVNRYLNDIRKWNNIKVPK